MSASYRRRREGDSILYFCTKEIRKANVNFCIKVNISCFGVIYSHIRDLFVFPRMISGPRNFLPHFFINYNAVIMLEVNIRCARGGIGAHLTRKGNIHDPIGSIRTQRCQECSPGGFQHSAANLLLDLDRDLSWNVSSLKGKRSAGKSLGPQEHGSFPLWMRRKRFSTGASGKRPTPAGALPENTA